MVDEKDQELEGTHQLEAQFTHSSLFRVVRADGAWGGLMPNGNISMAIYTEHLPLADNVTYEVSSSGGAKEIGRKETPGVVIREVEVEVLMSLGVATATRNWLDRFIQDAARAAELLRARRQSEQPGKSQ